MFDYRITFQSPWYFLLLLVIPPLWWSSFGDCALGPYRRIFALSLRTLLLLLILAALTEVRWSDQQRWR